MTRKYKCYCGNATFISSQVGSPPDCMGCDECFSTLAESSGLCKQRTLHEWVYENDQKVCIACNTREAEDAPRQEFAMIFKNHKNEWINDQGEVMAQKLVDKYNISGRYRRDGTFEPRDDMRSMLVNKPLVIQKDFDEVEDE